MTKIIEILIAERNSPSDESILCLETAVDSGNFIEAGTAVIELEGAKAIFEVRNSQRGFIYFLVMAGDVISVGTKLAIITSSEAKESELEKIKFELDIKSNATQDKFDLETRLSKPAREFVNQSNLDLSMILPSLPVDRLVTLNDIQKVIDSNSSSGSLSMPQEEIDHWNDFLHKNSNLNKCIFVGGGRGSVQVMDILAKNLTFIPVGYFSDSEDNYIKPLDLMNFGATTIENIRNVIEQQGIMRLILTVGSSPKFRIEMLKKADQLGVTFETLVDPSAQIGNFVKVGAGTIVFANTHIGTCSVLGQGCFISSNSSIEHHNQIGDGFCTGPGLNTSGGVKIGRQVRFGTNIAIEPNIAIGDNCTVASGITLTKNVQSGKIIKLRS
jgi:hypothetical protein